MPGLRREELARLAGVSPDYCVRLEQGRATGVSDEVLRAIGRALRLSGLEQAHLARLAREPRGGGPRPVDVVDGDVRRLLDAMVGLPVHVIGRRTDVIAWDAAADAVFRYGDRSAPPDIARRLFTDPDSRVRYPNWAELAAPLQPQPAHDGRGEGRQLRYRDRTSGSKNRRWATTDPAPCGEKP